MSSLRLRTIAIVAAAAASTLVPGAASAGVVVAASGPSAGSFPVGRKIGDSERIVLRAGDSLTVLDGKGTRVLRGAGTFSLDQQAGPSKRGTFAVLTERRSASRMRTGAVRGDDTAPLHSPNLWYVDVDRPGKICLAGTERVRLWRKATEGDVSYVISAAEGGASHTVTFADGEMLAPWNTRLLPVAADTTYRLAGDDGVVVSEMSFVVLDSIAEEPEALAEQLIDNGCTTQLELLSTAMAIDEG
ncbi:MAG TPA: hypothetical protein VEB68_01320 [Croceibacterium sp.]|nr:hypothetical protein [Croceibacterium sp.]